jgi:5'-deoxynucleotidase YfbR-like HD superfamily hydrolase
VTDEPDQATTDDSQVAAIVDYFFEAGALKRLPRTGWLNAGIKHPESVAEHSYRTGLIGAVLAVMEGADPAKVALMGVIHDTQETRIGDIAYIGRRYVKAADNRDVTADQTAGAPAAVRDTLGAIVDEIESYETKESIIHRDADKLECLLQAIEYRETGNTNMQQFYDSMLAALATPSAKAIGHRAVNSNSQGWSRHA